MFVLKKDRSLYFCIDYCILNKVTRKNCYTFLLISKILDCLTRAIYFTKFDFKNTYYRIPIAEKDCWKTVFCIYYRYFEYIVILFGLTNTPATF